MMIVRGCVRVCGVRGVCYPRGVAPVTTSPCCSKLNSKTHWTPSDIPVWGPVFLFFLECMVLHSIKGRHQSPCAHMMYYTAVAWATGTRRYSYCIGLHTYVMSLSVTPHQQRLRDNETKRKW